MLLITSTLTLTYITVVDLRKHFISIYIYIYKIIERLVIASNNL